MICVFYYSHYISFKFAYTWCWKNKTNRGSNHWWVPLVYLSCTALVWFVYEAVESVDSEGTSKGTNANVQLVEST